MTYIPCGWIVHLQNALCPGESPSTRLGRALLPPRRARGRELARNAAVARRGSRRRRQVLNRVLGAAQREARAPAPEQRLGVPGVMRQHLQRPHSILVQRVDSGIAPAGGKRVTSHADKCDAWRVSSCWKENAPTRSCWLRKGARMRRACCTLSPHRADQHHTRCSTS